MSNKKAGARPAFLLLAANSGGSFLREFFDLGIQAALMTSGLVFVDDAFVGNAIDDRNGSGVSSFSSFGIAFVDRGNNFLDVGAHHRAQAAVVQTSVFCLLGAFPRLFSVRHRKTPEFES
jgi:hypothetical protein